MKRPHDALRLDIAAFIADGVALAGAWAGASLGRLAGLQTPPQDTALADVAWQAQGALQPVAGGQSELWLVLHTQAGVWLTCQRCLQPFKLPLLLDRRIRFVRGEAEAEALDAELDDDVLATSRSFDLRGLVEDELLLALPIVPRHADVCPQPLPLPAGDLAQPADLPMPANPFVVLQGLKTAKPGSEPG